MQYKHVIVDNAGECFPLSKNHGKVCSGCGRLDLQ